MARKPRFNLDPEKFPLGSTKRRKALDRLRKRADRLRDCPRGARHRRGDPLIGICGQCGCTFRCWSGRAIYCGKECADQHKKNRQGWLKPAWNRDTDPQNAGRMIDLLLVPARRHKAKERYRLPDDYPAPPWLTPGNGCWIDPWWCARRTWLDWEQDPERDVRSEPPLPVPGSPSTWGPWVPAIKVEGKTFKLRTPDDVRKLRRAQDSVVQFLAD